MAPIRGPGFDMSLDDIIRNKKGPRAAGKNVKKPTGGVKKTPFKKGPATGAKPFDARNKIILKKRTQITDARDKLAQMARGKDAREKLDLLRSKRMGNARGIGNVRTLTQLPLSLKTKGARTPQKALFSDLSRQVAARPFQMSRVAHMNRINRTNQIAASRFQMDEAMDEEYVPAPLKPIVRSISNNRASFPPTSIFSQHPRIRKQISLKDKTILSDSRGFNLKIVAKNDAAPLRAQRRDETIYLSDEGPVSPVSILKKRPGRMRSDAPPAPTHHEQAEGFRIVVSNLRSSVTGADIQELFGDVGELAESRLVRPGTAEVIYSTLKDAQKAVDVYHNRQLDGQPMKCFLVMPRNPSAKIKPETASRLGAGRPGKPSLPASSNSSVVPDISTFHKVLFRKH